MNKEEYQVYLQSSAWRSFRRDYILDCGYKCQMCGLSTRFLQVHHKTYKNVGNEKPEDVIAICESCHQKTHGLYIKPNKSELKRKLKESYHPSSISKKEKRFQRLQKRKRKRQKKLSALSQARRH
jgi:5-methylcytosine-specific restriction endonuclease McrA